MTRLEWRNRTRWIKLMKARGLVWQRGTLWRRSQWMINNIHLTIDEWRSFDAEVLRLMRQKIRNEVIRASDPGVR